MTAIEITLYLLGAFVFYMWNKREGESVGFLAIMFWPLFALSLIATICIASLFAPFKDIKRCFNKP